MNVKYREKKREKEKENIKVMDVWDKADKKNNNWEEHIKDQIFPYSE